MSHKPSAKYIALSTLCGAAALAGCDGMNKIHHEATVAIRLTPDSAKTVRSGQYCESDLREFFQRAIVRYQSTPAHEKPRDVLLDNVPIARVSDKTTCDKERANPTIAASGGGGAAAAAGAARRNEEESRTLSLTFKGSDVFMVQRGVFCQKDIDGPVTSVIRAFERDEPATGHLVVLPRNPVLGCMTPKGS